MVEQAAVTPAVASLYTKYRADWASPEGQLAAAHQIGEQKSGETAADCSHI